MADTQATGQRAEDAAHALLSASGLAEVCRNYRCRGGEIDLIMRDGDCLVFVEVRYRRSGDFGGALSSVDARKRRRLTIAAAHYLASSGWSGPCRFDVVGYQGGQPGTWIRDAFTT
ncbi:MAG: YraN family protein [Gammaproteobacteria bacterium]|nr:YraN family protein [Gammaproteobacteria bacterium]